MTIEIGPALRKKLDSFPFILREISYGCVYLFCVIMIPMSMLFAIFAMLFAMFALVFMLCLMPFMMIGWVFQEAINMCISPVTNRRIKIFQVEFND